MPSGEQRLEDSPRATLQAAHQPGIRDRTSPEGSLREKFELLIHRRLTDEKFLRRLDDIAGPAVYECDRPLRGRETFVRDEGTPFKYLPVNTMGWCRNSFEAAP